MDNYVYEALQKISENNRGISIEFILVDIASTDNTVLTSIEAIKQYNLVGCVIQNGKSSISEVLNTGIKRATGSFITFEFLENFCSDYIKDYYDFAKDNNVQVILNKPNGNESKFIETDRNLLISDLPNNINQYGLNKIFINTAFIQKNNIFINKSCEKYSHYDLLYKLFILGKDIYFCEKNYTNDLNFEGKSLFKKKKSSFFEFVDTNINLCDFIQKKCRNDKSAREKIRYDVLPNAILNCVNKLLQEGYKPSSIKNSLKLRGYDFYLKFDKSYSLKLNKDIIMWKRLSFVYNKFHISQNNSGKVE